MSDPISDTPGPPAATDGGQPTPRAQDPRPLSIIVRGHARPDQIEQAKLALKEIADPTRANTDCLEFRMYQDRDDPRSFILWERWASEEALWAHGDRDYMAEYNAQKDKIFESIGGEFLQEIHPLDDAL
jgi:quinol monooxygenase YgiN